MREEQRLLNGCSWPMADCQTARKLAGTKLVFSWLISRRMRTFPRGCGRNRLIRCDGR